MRLDILKPIFQNSLVTLRIPIVVIRKVGASQKSLLLSPVVMLLRQVVPNFPVRKATQGAQDLPLVWGRGGLGAQQILYKLGM